MLLGRALPRNAQLYPGRPAIVEAGGRTLTYHELNGRVHRLANALLARGLGKGQRLAILGRSSAAYLEAYFAAARIGLWQVPLNFHLKSADIGHRLLHSGASAMLIDREFAPLFDGLEPAARAALGDRVWTMDGAHGIFPSMETLVAEGGAVPPDVRLDPEDILYIGYTSGTTGPAKGALVSHRAIVTGYLYKALAYGLGPDDVTLDPGPFWHSAPRDYASLACYLGGTAIVTRGFEPSEYLELVQRHRVTNSFLVPTMVQMLTSLEGNERYDTSSLRLVLSGGSPLPTAVKDRAVARFGPILHEFYGATETRMITSVSTPELAERRRTVGRAMRDVEIRVLDEDGEERPRGEVGEIFVRGPGLYSGYHEDPERTRAAQRGEWFSLGDLGRMDDDGYLYLVDRKQDMIISGGENIYPNDIEEVLAACQGVKEAAVIGVPDPTWGEAVTAVVVPAPGAQLSAEALIAACAARLPAYMKPRAVAFAEALPRNPVGKVLRRVLREPYWRRQEEKI
ncbi:MAG: AMP-binding protein [Burkholderiales bacterium]|nr:AMP-binding protein [Burkholderiales bacterium]